MTTLSATELARNLSRVLDRVEHEREEVVIVRNKHTVARIVPGVPGMTATEALSDLYRTISDEEGKRWLHDSRRLGGTLKKELRDPWA